MCVWLSPAPPAAAAATSAYQPNPTPASSAAPRAPNSLPGGTHDAAAGAVGNHLAPEVTFGPAAGEANLADGLREDRVTVSDREGNAFIQRAQQVGTGGAIAETKELGAAAGSQKGAVMPCRLK